MASRANKLLAAGGVAAGGLLIGTLLLLPLVSKPEPRFGVAALCFGKQEGSTYYYYLRIKAGPRELTQPHEGRWYYPQFRGPGENLSQVIAYIEYRLARTHAVEKVLPHTTNVLLKNASEITATEAAALGLSIGACGGADLERFKELLQAFRM